MYKIAFMSLGKANIDLSLIDYVKNPMSLLSGDGYTHETVTATVIKNVVDYFGEEVEIIQVENSYKGLMWCVQNDVNILNVSYGNIAGVSLDYTYQKALENNLKIITSAGNEYNQGETHLATKDNYVTAVAAVDENGNHLDFSSWGGGHVDIACLGKHKINGRYRQGTSFASPVATALTAIYDIKFHNKYGRYMTMKEQYKFYKEKCFDIEEEGKDLKTGYGWLKEESIEGEVISLADYFKDDNGKWYEDDVNYLAATGVIKGYEDGTIKGDENITRAEVFNIAANIKRDIEKLKQMID